MKKAEPQVPFVPYRSDDRTPHERVLEMMDMTHAKTCRILKQLGRAWPRPADEPAWATSATWSCIPVPSATRSSKNRNTQQALPAGRA